MKKTLILLILLAQFSSAHYFTQGDAASVMFSNEPPIAGNETLMQVYIENATGGAFAINHEKYLHTIIIGQDLETFAHIHPDDFPNGLTRMEQGLFYLNHTFPKAGTYTMLFDYTLNGNQTSQQLSVEVIGDEYLTNYTPLFEREQSFNDYTITLNAPTFHAGDQGQATYHIQKAGKNVNDLQLYLGTEVHVVAIDTNLKNAFHTHTAMPEGMQNHTGMQHYYGPTIPVDLTFPQPGIYAVFGDFKHEGKVIHTRFFIEANETRIQQLRRISPYITLACIFALALLAVNELRKRIK